MDTELPKNTNDSNGAFSAIRKTETLHSEFEVKEVLTNRDLKIFFSLPQAIYPDKYPQYVHPRGHWTSFGPT